MTPSQIEVVEDAAELARVGARVVARLATEAVRERGAFAAALSGGRTPRVLYERLAGDESPLPPVWRRTRLFVGDERDVPPDHADSNARMMREALVTGGPLRDDRLHRFRTELADPESAVADYEATLRRAVAQDPEGLPRFDLVLLGLGTDGHTASLFPGSPLLAERERLAGSARVESMGGRRYTLTPPVINAASAVIFLVSGADKAEVLREILDGAIGPDERPARVVRPRRGSLSWLVDRQAAARLA